MLMCAIRLLTIAFITEQQETATYRDYTVLSIGVNHGGGDASPKKIYGGDGYITIPKYGWLPGQPTRLQHAFL